MLKDATPQSLNSELQTLEIQTACQVTAGQSASELLESRPEMRGPVCVVQKNSIELNRAHMV